MAAGIAYLIEFTDEISTNPESNASTLTTTLQVTDGHGVNQAELTVMVYPEGSNVPCLTAITSSAGSVTATTLTSGTYLFVVSNGTQVDTNGLISITAGNTIPLVFAPPVLQYGSIAGTVQSAAVTEGSPYIAGVAVNLYNSTLTNQLASTTTDLTGAFHFASVVAGTYCLGVSYPGYAAQSLPVVVTGTAQTTELVTLFTMLPPGALRAVLTWGAEPADLDLHMLGPTITGGTFHVYYNQMSQDTASLIADVSTGYGPEAITVSALHPGTYQLFVHDNTNRALSTSMALSASGATVTLYNETGVFDTFTVLSGGGTLWAVCTIDGATGNVTPVETMTYQSNPSAI